MGIQVPKTNTIGQKINNISTNSALKKKLEEKISEKAKLHKFIGIQTYDLYKAGKIAQPELEVYFEKMNELDQEIAAIEAEIEQANAPAGAIKCSCGNLLPPGSKFCSQCGKTVETDFILCSCGGQVKRDMSFCPNCGQRVVPLPAANAAGQANGGTVGAAGNAGGVQGKECICGALIPVGQSMCMECGRKVSD